MRRLETRRLGLAERSVYWVLVPVVACMARMSPAWAQLSGTTLGDEWGRLMGVGAAAFGMIQTGSWIAAGFAGLGAFLCWLFSFRPNWRVLWTVLGTSAGIALITTVMDFVFVIDTPETLTDGAVIQTQ